MTNARSVLLGRDSETAQLNALLADARHGRSAVLVLDGEPGVGKSALLRNVIEQAPGFQVLWSQGLQSEIEIPYGGLGPLIRPLRQEISQLSSSHSAALTWVLGMGMETGGEGSALSYPPDRFAVGAALLALMAAAAEPGPVIAVLDDAQWLDESSVDALTFVTRRLLREGVLVLLSKRTNEGSRGLSALPSLRLDGLAPADAKELLTGAGNQDLDEARVEQLVSASAGNPLALLELPRLLGADELSGLVPVHRPLPIGDTLLHAYSATWSRLSEGCRLAAAVTALLSQADLRSVDRALGEAQLSMSDLEEAEDAQILDVTAAGVVFRHPLARSAAAYSIQPSWRRRAHAAVGRALAGSPALNQRIEGAWHLAAAATGLSEETAAMLERAAEQAVSQSGVGASVVAYERAAQLSPGEVDRRRRLVLGANAAYHAGMFPQALRLLDLADELDVDDPDSGLLFARTRVRLDMSLGLLAEAEAVAAGAAEQYARTYPLDTAPVMADGGRAAIHAGDAFAARRGFEMAVELARADETLRLVLEAALGGVLVLQGEFTEGFELLQPSLSLAAEISTDGPSFVRDFLLADPHNLHSAAWFARTLSLLGEFPVADALSMGVLHRADEVGALTIMPTSLTNRAFIALRRGDGPTARATAARSLALAQEMGLHIETAEALSVDALAEAHFGSRESCRASVALGLDAATRSGAGYNTALLYLALGVVELGARQIEAAVTALEKCRSICERGGLLDFAYWHWAPELVEAYASGGEAESARQILEQLDVQAARSARPILKAFAARCHGLLDQEYEAAFEAALHHHEGTNVPFELARTQLAYGSRLRRDRRRGAARHQLEAAFTRFRSLGAQLWAEYARTELAAAGVVFEAASLDSAMSALTAQELQVAVAVAQGATNREAAAQLFLSPKTVEYHLSRIFRKLQVDSRRELSAVITRG